MQSCAAARKRVVMADKGRARKGKRTQIAGQFAWRLIDMLESPAYRALSLSAHRVLARLEIEIAKHGGNDNGKLPCTFDDFAAYGISRRLIAPAIREVEALGFVAISERGRAGNAEWRRPNVYRLTYRHTSTTEPTDEWRAFSTLEAAEAAAATARETKSQYHKVNHTLGLKVNRSRPVLGAESDTTGHGSLSDPLSISRGQGVGGRAGARRPTKQASASGPIAQDLEAIGAFSSALLNSRLVKSGGR